MPFYYSKETRSKNYKEYAEALVEYFDNIASNRRGESQLTGKALLRFKHDRFKNFDSVIRTCKDEYKNNTIPVFWLSKQNNLSSYLSRMIELAEELDDKNLKSYLVKAKQLSETTSQELTEAERKIHNLSILRNHFGKPTFLNALENEVSSKIDEITGKLKPFENESLQKKFTETLTKTTQTLTDLFKSVNTTN